MVFPMMTYPTVTSQDSYLQALKDMDNGVEGAREVVHAAQHDPSVPLGRLYIHNMIFAPTPSVDTLLHTPMLLDEPGPSQFPQVLPLVFIGTPIPQPSPMPAMGTLAGRANIPPSPHFFPPRKKLAKKGMLTEATDLSVFDILNIF
jgi:hypothetical protein